MGVDRLAFDHLNPMRWIMVDAAEVIALREGPAFAREDASFVSGQVIYVAGGPCD